MRGVKFGRGVVALVAACAGVPVGPPAAAHQIAPYVFTVLDSVTPPLDGVTVKVRAGVADQLLVVNATDSPVEVLDDAGRPFLRIGPERIEGDESSPAWHTSDTPLGVAAVPAPGPPRWGYVARGGTWGWFDHRLHPAPLTAPPEARAATTLVEWRVPLRHRGTTHVVAGRVEHRPLPGTIRSRVARGPRGAVVEVGDGRVPALTVTRRGAGTLVVTGADGAPFARLSSFGVEADGESPTWLDDRRLRGIRSPTVPYLVLDEEIHWRRVGSGDSYSWFDWRLAYGPGQPPEDVVRSRRVTTLVEWDIAVDVDGVLDHVQGVTEWVPDDVVEPSGRVAVGATVAVYALVAVTVTYVVRRRSRGHLRSTPPSRTS